MLNSRNFKKASQRKETDMKHIDNWIKALHYDIISPAKGGGQKVSDYMTGREVVNLIEKLEQEGMSAEKIIEIIKYIETHVPESK